MFNFLGLDMFIQKKWLAKMVMYALLGISAPIFAAPNNANNTESNLPISSSETEIASGTIDNQDMELLDSIMQQAQEGPATIELGKQAVLNLPKGMMFLPKEAANKLMQFWGNRVSEARYGLILPQNEENWFADLTYDAVGYIKDDEAKNWDTDALLKNIKEGTEEQNKIRVSQGIAEVETHGWIEKPQYNEQMHHLIWSVDVYQKGGQDPDPSINYNTSVLGRYGYIDATLVTSLSHADAIKPIAQEILSAITFKEGQRYSDFNEVTDKVAEYGLAALVGGVAAKKLGLLALIGATLVKFWKLVIVGFVALGAWFKKRNNRE